MNILIIGGGYVGLATAYLFKKHRVYIYDTGEINTQIIPISIREKINYKCASDLNIEADCIFICVPTNQVNNMLDTSIIEQYLYHFKDKAKVIVRSTVPIGFCEKHSVQYMPEFLTEKDPFKKPDRIVWGGLKNHWIDEFIGIEKIRCSPTQAEIIKLSANAYLSMRLAYFQEIERICKTHNVGFGPVHFGVCTDPRIGFNYANPPFLINGKCLPKDLQEISQHSALFSEVNNICKSQKVN